VNFLRFSELEGQGCLHGFTLRSDPALGTADIPQILKEAGLPQNYVMGEQIHGAEVAVVGLGEGGRVIPGVDGLVTIEKNVSLVIRVADCGPVWIEDKKTGGIGLVHSGKKGTEAGVVPATIRKMKERFGSEPKEMRAVLGPCIRPPHYEVDFAGEILRQLAREGVGQIVDTKICTPDDLGRFYSYRSEKGETGRHYAVMAMS
jgi:copper oxidase (laccase) domain-containing protein